MKHHRIWWMSTWVLAAASVGGGWLPMSANAETYIAAQGGYTVAQDATRVKTNDPQFVGLPAGTTASNVDLNNALMYGMKVGHYFDSTPWLGLELESFVTTPHVPQQNLTLTIPGVGQTTINQVGATNRLIVVAPNVVARYRAGKFEPYVGVGPGIFLLHEARQPNSPGTAAYSQSTASVGLNTQVGVRTYLTEHISLFGEWKYNYFRASLSGASRRSVFRVQCDSQFASFRVRARVPFLETVYRCIKPTGLQ